MHRNLTFDPLLARVLLLLKKTVKTDCDIFGPKQEVIFLALN